MRTGTFTKQYLTFLGILALCLAFSQVSTAQTDDRSSSYILDSNSVIHLKGTSPLHDWGMIAHSFTGSANFSFDANHQLSSITQFSLTLPVHNLISESTGMEKNAYKALKEDKFKYIVFELTSANFIKSGSEHYVILLHGNLTMAGVTQPTTLKSSARINEDGTIMCSGELPVYMSDFNIERPTYLLGTMKVGDLLVLTYNLLLVKMM
jgi:polyisoprenoid-binding protein YceI